IPPVTLPVLMNAHCMVTPGIRPTARRGLLTPPFHFVSLKPHRVAADRGRREESGSILGIQSRKESRWPAQPPRPTCLLRCRTRPPSSESRAFVPRAKPAAGIHRAVVPLRTSSRLFSFPSCDTIPSIRKRTIAIGLYCQKVTLLHCSLRVGLKPASFPSANFSSSER